MQRYADLTRSASKDEPALIVWPEAATPGLVLKDMPLLNQLVTLAKQSRTHLLIGSTEYPKFPDDSAKLRRAGNTAVYFSPEGKVAGQYLKIRSVPFGEYLPFEGKIRWPRFIVPDPNANYEIPGKEFTLFELEDHKFGVAICWESHFPGLFRQFVRQGAKFMLNIANEGRYGETAASAQMLAINQFRAIENRISIARATNTGISCFIDPFGRVMSRIYDNGRDIFIKGYLTQEISLLQKRSFYTNYGYIFVYLNIIAAGLMIFLSLIRGKKNRII
jgi:apolipoprotein N-acyltransferase